MRIGLVSNAIGTGSLEDVIEEARIAAQDGFHTFWSSQIFGFDALTVLPCGTNGWASRMLEAVWPGAAPIGKGATPAATP